MYALSAWPGNKILLFGDARLHYPSGLLINSQVLEEMLVYASLLVHRLACLQVCMLTCLLVHMLAV